MPYTQHNGLFPRNGSSDLLNINTVTIIEHESSIKKQSKSQRQERSFNKADLENYGNTWFSGRRSLTTVQMCTES